jgi:hypothetical protein
MTAQPLLLTRRKHLGWSLAEVSHRAPLPRLRLKPPVCLSHNRRTPGGSLPGSVLTVLAVCGFAVALIAVAVLMVMKIVGVGGWRAEIIYNTSWLCRLGSGHSLMHG